MQKVVTLGGDIGIQVEFQIDALEPFEQVLAEIHNVMRCSVRADGRRRSDGLRRRLVVQVDARLLARVR
jgi:hypothetical protein